MGDWLGLAADGPERFALPLTRRLCAPAGPLFGGATLAALVCAAERASKREALWAHAHFARPATAPQRLGVEVAVRSSGRRQALLDVTARQGADVTANALVATVDRVGAGRRIAWVSPPPAPPPDECPERRYADPDPTSINGTLDVRIAHPGRRGEGAEGSPDGRCVLWARLREAAAPGAAHLALLADHVPFAARQALGNDVGVASLDSSLRIFDAATGDDAFEWVLLDIALTAVEGAHGHGRVTLWSASGTLLAEGSQNFLVL